MESEINQPTNKTNDVFNPDSILSVIHKHFADVQLIPRPGILSFSFSRLLNDFDIIRKDFEGENVYPFLRKNISGYSSDYIHLNFYADTDKKIG